jgi:transposase
MPKKLHEVKLTAAERQELERVTRKGEVQVRVYKRARILLLADQGLRDTEIIKRVGTSRATVARIRKRYQEEKARDAIAERARPGRPSIFDGETRAKITALACSSPPQGRARWDLRLLADKAVELEYVNDISHVTVGKMLKKTNSSRTLRSSGA